MKKLRSILLNLMVLFAMQSCVWDDGTWDPNRYKVVELNANFAFYSFKTGLTSSQMPADVDDFGIINEPWCTDLPALCGNFVATGETEFTAFTEAPASGYENHCLNVELNQVLVFKLGDGSLALVKVVNDQYIESTTGCEHQITLHINYPAFTSSVKEEEEEGIVHTNGKGFIDEQGGTIKVSDPASDINGVSIVIPPGALPEGVEISISNAEADFLLKEVEPNAIWIKFEPSGLHFEKPVRIGIPYSLSTGLHPDSISMYWSNGVDDGGPVPLFEIDYTNKIYYGGLDHFSYFGLTTLFGSGADSKWFRDTRDDEYYLTHKIGNQWWFCNDARYKVSGSKVYNDDESKAPLYGRLYTWNMAKQACPSGWRVPSKEDWETLEKTLGMTDAEIRKKDGIRTETDVIRKLVGMGVVSYLQGMYLEGEGYDALGDFTIYWTSTESFGDKVWTWDLYQGMWHFMPMDDGTKSHFYSLKCVK